MSRAADPHRGLIAALEDRLGPLDDLVSVARAWSSATFTGARHTVSFAADAGHRQALDGLGEADLPIAGHFVADIVVGEDDPIRTRIEALTIEEA